MTLRHGGEEVSGGNTGGDGEMKRSEVKEKVDTEASIDSLVYKKMSQTVCYIVSMLQMPDD